MNNIPLNIDWQQILLHLLNFAILAACLIGWGLTDKAAYIQTAPGCRPASWSMVPMAPSKNSRLVCKASVKFMIPPDEKDNPHCRRRHICFSSRSGPFPFPGALSRSGRCRSPP